MMATEEYCRFIENKRHHGAESGFAPVFMPPAAFDFQQSLIDFALRRGRSAIFADCGLGKTLIELAWAENVIRKTNRPVLLLTPIAVGSQTLRESQKFGIQASRSRNGKIPASPMVVVSNYERLHHFDPHQFAGVVCDESSAIKNFNGQRKAEVTKFMKNIPYRLLATATAAPNDYIELGTSSEALGELGYMDMLNRFFRNDQNTSDTRRLKRQPVAFGGPKSAGWRFKGHAEDPFWRYVVGWARACRKPSDLGFSDNRFDLVPMIERDHLVETKTLADGMLFAFPAGNAREEREERRRTIIERCERVRDLVIGRDDPSVIWCHLNDEGDILQKMIPNCAQVAGETDEESREEIYDAFAAGQLQNLVIKDRIGAWGMNWQHCSHVVRFATHSYESHYQAIRRCWRFGQTKPVTVDLVFTEGEAAIKDNLRRKSEQSIRMFSRLVEHMNNAIRFNREEYSTQVEVPSWL